MAQEDNYLKEKDYSHLLKMMQVHGTDSLSGLQRSILGLGPVPQVQQQEKEFSPHVETYSAMEDESEPMLSAFLPKPGEDIESRDQKYSAYQKLRERMSGGAASEEEVEKLSRMFDL